jgi:endogenous inhibitor of DNA gyrase (YacG/DUF329 family)
MVKEMTVVRCPACNERVEGSSSEDLSRSMRVHFSDVHEVESAPERSTPSSSTSSPGENPEDRAPVRKPFRPTPDRGIGPGAQTSPTEGSFEAGSAGKGEFGSSKIAPEETGGEEITSFQCPICGDTVRGESEEELSSSFGNHLVDSHRDEPFVNRLLVKPMSR